VVAFESGVTDTVDPLGGSYFIETLTEQLENEARNLISLIDDMGGSVSAVESGWMQEEIGRSSYAYQQAIDRKDKIIVGMNEFVSKQPAVSPPILSIDDAIRQTQTDALKKLRAERDQEAVQKHLQELGEAARNGNNIMPFILNAVESYATLGEIADILRQEFGEFGN
jgi:methylmalonyl-CoA mutase N-terminal domain/subunit